MRFQTHKTLSKLVGHEPYSEENKNVENTQKFSSQKTCERREKSKTNESKLRLTFGFPQRILGGTSQRLFFKKCQNDC